MPDVHSARVCSPWCRLLLAIGETARDACEIVTTTRTLNEHFLGDEALRIFTSCAHACMRFSSPSLPPSLNPVFPPSLNP
eukprot:6212648-Pleurochrysis_carterae.AAC.1